MSYVADVDSAWLIKQSVVELLGREVLFNSRPGGGTLVSFHTNMLEINLIKLCHPNVKFRTARLIVSYG